MPRYVKILNDDETCEIGGLRLRVRLVRAGGRRLRVVLDVPPRWRFESAGIDGAEQTDAAGAPRFARRGPDVG